MKRLFDVQDRRQAFRLLVEANFDRIQRAFKEGSQEDFKKQLSNVIPGVKRYISNRLSTAVKNGYIDSGEYKVDDFVNELYILAHEKFNEVKRKEELRGWLIQKADELLKSTIADEEFERFFFENIDNYSKDELNEMVENFSTDGDGDIVMEEELDDLSYPKHNYVLKDVFVEDIENELIEKLQRELNKDEIHQQINAVVHKLPLPIRTVFNLAVNHQFRTDEIADIQMIPEKKVKEFLMNARRVIRVSFEKQYAVAKPQSVLL